MIEGICGEPFVDMTEYVDMDKLSSLFLPIAKGIAQCGPLPITYFPPKTKNRGYKDMNDLAQCDDPAISEEYSAILSTLTPQQRYRFAELTNGVISSGSYIELRHSVSRRYKDIFTSELCQDNINAQLLFPELMEFVQSLPFDSIGRIVIFISSPFVEGQIHSDLVTAQEFLFPPLENKDAYKDNNFIWFNPGNRKKFFIYDEETDNKLPVTSEACFFNTWDYHGSDISNTTTFSFRVDGRFTSDLRILLGI